MSRFRIQLIQLSTQLSRELILMRPVRAANKQHKSINKQWRQVKGIVYFCLFLFCAFTLRNTFNGNSTVFMLRVCVSVPKHNYGRKYLNALQSTTIIPMSDRRSLNRMRSRFFTITRSLDDFHSPIHNNSNGNLNSINSINYNDNNDSPASQSTPASQIGISFECCCCLCRGFQDFHFVTKIQSLLDF